MIPLAATAVAVAIAPALTPAPASVVLDFADHPGKYRGRTMTFALRLPTGLRESFRDVSFPEPGGQCRFYARYGDPPARVEVTAAVAGVQAGAPNVRGGDPVWLTFRCDRGRADAGNVALAIRRPPARGR